MSRVPEPEGFDEQCRKRGQRWLREHAADVDRPRDFWSPFRPALAEGFRWRCAYVAARRRPKPAAAWIATATGGHTPSADRLA